jgi:methylmalonyl-CoA/ethylmalonyl-CoA epimerase
MARFSRGKGDAIHHFCLVSDNIEEDVEALKKRGVEMMDQKPRIGLRGKKIAMTMPSALNGITIELSEP